jgi:hypothetical protein
LKKIVLVIFATALVLGLVGCRPDQQMSPPVAETAYDNYAGSEACAGCHSSIYNKFIQSGHPYKLTKVVNGQKPLVYPFTSLPDIPNMNGLKDGDNSLGRPDSYGEVSYVIGGYNWKARFVDLNGYIITGSDVQYNYETGGWVSYHNDEVDKPYDCGKCHTTMNSMTNYWASIPITWQLAAWVNIYAPVSVAIHVMTPIPVPFTN